MKRLLIERRKYCKQQIENYIDVHLGKSNFTYDELLNRIVEENILSKDEFIIGWVELIFKRSIMLSVTAYGLRKYRRNKDR